MNCWKILDIDIKDVVMTDVCPFSLGTGTVMDEGDINPHMTVMIPRSSTLPAEHTDRFYTICHNQNEISLKIFQGESYFTKDNLRLGEIKMPVSPMIKGRAYVTVTFRYDIDGILNVEATSCDGIHKELTIVGESVKLTNAEREKRVEKLKEIVLSERGADEVNVLMERLLSLYEEVPVVERGNIQYMIESLRSALNSGRIAESKMVVSKIKRYLEDNK